MSAIVGAERAALIEEVKRRIAADTQRVGAPGRTDVWERGWHEALMRYRWNPEPDSLIPAFIHRDRPMRYCGQFWNQDDEINELGLMREVQGEIAQLLKGCANVVEVGCGTGFNLLALQRRNKDAHYIGLDFAPSAVTLVQELGFEAHWLDMRRPDFDIPADAGVFTYGAVEQLAGDFVPFMEWLLGQKPHKVVFVEPTLELYDPQNELDALSIAFHRKRGYTEGLLPWLQSDPRVDLLDVRRANFGNLMMESHAMMVWRPK